MYCVYRQSLLIDSVVGIKIGLPYLTSYSSTLHCNFRFLYLNQSKAELISTNTNKIWYKFGRISKQPNEHTFLYIFFNFNIFLFVFISRFLLFFMFIFLFWTMPLLIFVLARARTTVFLPIRFMLVGAVAIFIFARTWAVFFFAALFVLFFITDLFFISLFIFFFVSFPMFLVFGRAIRTRFRTAMLTVTKLCS